MRPWRCCPPCTSEAVTLKLADFLARLLRDGSHHLIVSSVTNHFDFDAEGYLDALDDDPNAAHFMERDVPLAPAEDRFVMPSIDIFEALPPEKRLILSNRQREQSEKDKAAAKRNKIRNLPSASPTSTRRT